MRTRLLSAIATVRAKAARWRLRRRALQQQTQTYWRHRERRQLRRLKLVAYSYSLRFHAASARERAGIAFTTLGAVAKALMGGGLLAATVLAAEQAIAHYAFSTLIPKGNAVLALDPLLIIAIPVSASFLGFYLASVSIVLGTSYHDVSPEVRNIVLANARTRVYLASIAAALGAGSLLLFLSSLDLFTLGYMTATSYALLLTFAGWAFFQLAFGSFNLFSHIILSEEPLRGLYQLIRILGSKGLLENEAVLRANARRVDHHLRILSELVVRTSAQDYFDRDLLVQRVAVLLNVIRIYASSKHMLSPTSEWFMPEPAYPRWIESNYSAMSLALKTSTPLQAQLAPVTDWLEQRSANLAAVALEAFLKADASESALRVTQASVETTRTLARCSHLAAAVTLSNAIRDCCWSGKHDNATARLLAFEPPRILSDLLLGWRDAIASWADEVQAAVAETDWDRASTSVVQIRGSARVWTAAQRLLREIHAEHAIQGQRVTPDWYLESTLATECILALREFAAQFPDLLDNFFAPGLQHSSATIRAAAGCQALQAIAKAETVVATIPQAVKALEGLQRVHERQPQEEFVGLAERVQRCREPVLQSLASAVTELQPAQSKSSPDLFGEAFFTLIHHTEEAVGRGDVDLVKHVFPQLLAAALTLQQHLVSTYKPPTYQVVPAIHDPVIDLLELSGLALIYEALREDDGSAGPIRAVWKAWNQETRLPPTAASAVLDILDLVTTDFLRGSPRGLIRTEWEQRLITRVVEAGYARPEHLTWTDPPTWTAPPLIKMLGVSESMPMLAIQPAAIFAVEVIGPLTAESEDQLRSRPGLRRYYEVKHHSNQMASDD